jgi:hypothetical protein
MGLTASNVCVQISAFAFRHFAFHLKVLIEMYVCVRGQESSQREMARVTEARISHVMRMRAPRFIRNRTTKLTILCQ